MEQLTADIEPQLRLSLACPHGNKLRLHMAASTAVTSLHKEGNTRPCHALKRASHPSLWCWEIWEKGNFSCFCNQHSSIHWKVWTVQPLCTEAMHIPAFPALAFDVLILFPGIQKDPLFHASCVLSLCSAVHEVALLGIPNFHATLVFVIFSHWNSAIMCTFVLRGRTLWGHFFVGSSILQTL